MLADLVAELQVEFPPAPIAMLENAIMDAARAFSKARPMHGVNTVPTQCGVDTYYFKDYLAIPDDYVFDRVTAVAYCGQCLPKT